MANLFHDILNSALIGTERKPYTPGQGEGAVGELIGALDASDGERALLGAAAASAQYQRAGAMPGKSNAALPEPAPDETLQRCSAASALHLKSMLNGRFSDALPEWLEAAANAGKRVPEESLPSLLVLGSRHADIAALVLPVAGERGRWLAGQNSSWKFAAGSSDDWQTATRATRLLLLKALRGTDPAAARAMLETTWATESAADRAEYVKCLSTGLSLEDEPFLEHCLDDRSGGVVEAASEALARVPGSSYSARMAARLEQIIVIGSGSKPKIEVVLPDSLDDMARRDGIVDQKEDIQGVKFGEHAAWVLQMLRHVPPGYWNVKSGKSTSELLKIAKKSSDWGDLLHHGWSRAAHFYSDVTWLLVLAQNGYHDALWDLGAMPPAVREQFLLDVIETPLFKDDDQRIEAFDSHRGAWSSRVSEKVLELLAGKRSVTRKQQHGYIGTVIGKMGYKMPPSTLERAKAILKPDDDKWDHWGPTIRAMIDVLEFRCEMLEVLSGDR